MITEINKRLKEAKIIDKDLTQEEAWKMVDFIRDVMEGIKEELNK